MLNAGATEDAPSADRQGSRSTPIRLLTRRKRYCTYDSPQAAAAITPDPWPEHSDIVDQLRVAADQLTEEAQLHKTTYTASLSVIDDMLDDAQHVIEAVEEQHGVQGSSPDGDADFGQWSRERSLPDSAPPVSCDDPVHKLPSQRSLSRADSARALPTSPVHRSSSPYSPYRRATMVALPSSPNRYFYSSYSPYRRATMGASPSSPNCRYREHSPGALAVSPLYWYLKSTRAAPHSPDTPGAAPNSPDDTCTAAPPSSPRNCDPSASAIPIHLPHIKVPRSSAGQVRVAHNSVEDWSGRHSTALDDDITRPPPSPISPSRRRSPGPFWLSPTQVADVDIHWCCAVCYVVTGLQSGKLCPVLTRAMCKLAFQGISAVRGQL